MTGTKENRVDTEAVDTFLPQSSSPATTPTLKGLDKKGSEDDKSTQEEFYDLRSFFNQGELFLSERDKCVFLSVRV